MNSGRGDSWQALLGDPTVELYGEDRAMGYVRRWIGVQPATASALPPSTRILAADAYAWITTGLGDGTTTEAVTTAA